MRRIGWRVVLAAGLLAGPAMIGWTAAPVSSTLVEPKPTFGAWVAEFKDDFKQLHAHPEAFDSVSLFYFSVTCSGHVLMGGAQPHTAEIAFCKAHHIKAFGTSASPPGGCFDAISGAKGDQVIADYVRFCEEIGLDGIDLDYEAMDKTWRPQYTVFVIRLGAALKAMNPPRLLSVTVQDFPSASDEASMAFDYEALGKVADQVRVMLYDYSYDKPGPIMPHGWYEDDLAFAASHIPKGKFIAALPWYGRDWTENGPDHEDLFWENKEKDTGLDGLQAVISKYHVKPEWDDVSGEYHFDYKKDGKVHHVWMPDPRKFSWMAKAALDAGASGFYVWYLAYAHPDNWKVLNEVTHYTPLYNH